MRLLSNPIYRFEAETDDSPDGAIFAYLRGWDAEILIVIETLETPEGLRWHYAPMRFCYLGARVMHKDKKVWVYERGGAMRKRKHFYYSVYGASIVEPYFD